MPLSPVDTKQIVLEGELEPVWGRSEAYQRYAVVAAQRIVSVGARMLWMGRVHFAVIAPESEQWDDAVLVEYPSRKAFLGMVSQPEYQPAASNRTAALEDSRLIATKTQASLVSDGTR